MKPNKLALLALLGIVLLSLTYTFTSPASAGTAVGADTGKKKHPFGATAASFSLRFAEANAKPTKQSRTLVVITTAVSLWHITETSLVTLARVKDDFDLILIDDKVTAKQTDRVVILAASLLCTPVTSSPNLPHHSHNSPTSKSVIVKIEKKASELGVPVLYWEGDKPLGLTHLWNEAWKYVEASVLPRSSQSIHKTAVPACNRKS